MRWQRILAFLFRNGARLAFIVLLAIFVASQTLVGFSAALGRFLASIGVETVSSVLDMRMKENELTKKSVENELAVEKQRANEELTFERRKLELSERNSARLSDENARLSANAKSLEAQRNNLSRTITETSQQNMVLKKALVDYSEELAALQQEVQQLKLAAEVNWKGKKVPLSDAVSEVSRTVKSRTKKVALANSASVVGEGIPVYGVGIIVAMLGYELKSACDTMKDMDELQKAIDPDAEVSSDSKEVCGMKIPTKEEVWAAIKNSPDLAWSTAIEAYDGALDSVPSKEEFRIASADFWDWTTSTFSGAGNAFVDGAVKTGRWISDTGTVVREGAEELGSGMMDGAKKAWNADCWVLCD